MSKTRTLKRKINQRKAEEKYKAAYKEYEKNKYTPKSMVIVVAVAVGVMAALSLAYAILSN